MGFSGFFLGFLGFCRDFRDILAFVDGFLLDYWDSDGIFRIFDDFLASF